MVDAKFVGIGAQRKSAERTELVVGWFVYTGVGKSLSLVFDGRVVGGVAEAAALIGSLEGVCYCSLQGIAYYVIDRAEGLWPYEEEEPDEEDKGACRLAADVARLRRVEADWPQTAFVARRGRLREQIRLCELNDEPGRGPLKRVMRRTSALQTDYVPVAAMAFQALRRAVARSGEGGALTEEDEHVLFEGRVGAFIASGRPSTRPLPDPQYAFAEEVEMFEDYERF